MDLRSSKNLILVVFLLGLAFFMACNNDDSNPMPPPTDDDGVLPPPPETIAKAIARRYLVVRATENAFELPLNFYDEFFVELTADEQTGLPGTYTVRPGDAPYIPNYNSPNIGPWSFDDNENPTQIFLGVAPDVSTLNITSITDSTALIISWILPAEDDNTRPTVKLSMEAQQ